MSTESKNPTYNLVTNSDLKLVTAKKLVTRWLHSVTKMVTKKSPIKSGLFGLCNFVTNVTKYITLKKIREIRENYSP